MTRELLTEDELKALLAADLDAMERQNKRWFWIRNALSLTYIAAMLVGLVFFPERIFAKFNLPESSAAIITGSYVQFRIAVIVVATFIYFVSYFMDRYFPYVAFAAFLIAIGNFVNDYFTIYIYAKPESTLIVYAISALRLTLIAMLYANFRFSLKAEFRYREN